MIIEKITFASIFFIYCYFIIYFFRRTNIVIGVIVLFATAILIGIIKDIIPLYIYTENKYIIKLYGISFGGFFEELIRTIIIIIFVNKFKISKLQAILSTALLYTIIENLYGFYPIYISYFDDIHDSAVNVLNSGFFNMFFSSLRLFTKFLMHFIYVFISVNSGIKRKYHFLIIVSLLHGSFNGIGYTFNIYYPIEQYAGNFLIFEIAKITFLYFVFYKVFKEEGLGINNIFRGLKRA